MGLGDRLVVLRDGLVQQIASPTAVYDAPANRFVASFVGTPSMNCIEGRLHRGDGGERFVADALRVELPAGKAVRATPGPIALGIRPDRLAIGRDADSAPWRGAAGVVAVELLGDRAEVVLDCGGVRLIARTQPRGLPKEGETCAIGFDPAEAHLFAEGPAGERVG